MFFFVEMTVELDSLASELISDVIEPNSLVSRKELTKCDPVQ